MYWYLTNLNNFSLFKQYKQSGVWICTFYIIFGSFIFTLTWSSVIVQSVYVSCSLITIVIIHSLNCISPGQYKSYSCFIRHWWNINKEILFCNFCYWYYGEQNFPQQLTRSFTPCTSTIGLLPGCFHQFFVPMVDVCLNLRWYMSIQTTHSAFYQ